MENNMEQPREPVFYPSNSMPVFSGNYNTLQSIDLTLKRMEKLLIQMKTRFSVSGDSDLWEQK